MTFNHLNRRLHLYLALALVPWLLIYGISSLIIHHRDWFDPERNPVEWTQRFERHYDLTISEDANLREIGAQIMSDNDLDGAFFINRRNHRIIRLTVFDFWNRTRLAYHLDQQQLTAEDQVFRWDQFILGLHFRGGFSQESYLSNLWGIVVDIACIGFVLWVASGIVMWWQLKQTRKWGALALGGGIVSFILFLFTL
jgi:hypothetical protein